MSLVQSFDSLKQRSVHARPRTRAASAILEPSVNKENVDSPVGHKPNQREKSVMAIAEMRDKEVGFVEDMTALLLTFLKPIADATGKHKYVRLLAHQLGDILRVSQWLRDALAEELRTSVTLENLPSILMEFSQKLAVFAPYCGNYLRYCGFFNRLATQNGRIGDLIREANNQGEDFMSFLIKPVQHALRYHLHVENYCKALSAANPRDSALPRLSECHRRLLDGGNAVNAAAGQMAEQQNTLQAIEGRFSPALPFALVVPCRVLMQEIRSITLTTVEGERARVDLFFFSDIVVCAVPNERGALRMCFSWKLRDTWVAPGTPHFPTAIQLIKVMEMAPYLVEFADVTSRNAFLTWFRDVLVETHLKTQKPSAYVKRTIIELSLDRDTGLYTALPRPPNFGQRISVDQYQRQVAESASKAETVLKTPEAQKLRKQAQKKKIAPLENILSLFQKD